MRYSVWVQCIPERLSWVKHQIKPHFPCNNFHHVCDTNRQGNMITFIRLLNKVPKDDYILFLEDDVFLAENLNSYMPTILSEMVKFKYDFVSLSGGGKKIYKDAYDRGIKYVKINNHWGHWGIVLSPFMIAAFLRYYNQDTNPEKDKLNADYYIREIFKYYQITPMMHIPNIVQHNIDMKSALNTVQNWTRKSFVYDPKFIVNL